jgi:hypothetical protein
MDDLLQQGITAYRAGKRDEARKFFAGAVKQNQNDERIWGWMYNVCDNDKERVHCLEQMLRINPKNEKANQLLSELMAADFPLERPSIPPTNLESQSTMKQKPPSVSTVQTEKNVVSQKTSDPTQQKNLQIGIGAILFICIICLCITFMPNLNKSNPPTSPEPTNITIDSHGVEIGTTADEVLAIRGKAISSIQVGQDSQGLVIEWTYPDVVYTMVRWELNGITTYRVWEINPR